VEELYYVSCQCCSSRAELWGGHWPLWRLYRSQLCQCGVCAPPPQGRYQTDTVMMKWGFPKKLNLTSKVL